VQKNEASAFGGADLGKEGREGGGGGGVVKRHKLFSASENVGRRTILTKTRLFTGGSKRREERGSRGRKTEPILGC